MSRKERAAFYLGIVLVLAVAGLREGTWVPALALVPTWIFFQSTRA